MPLCFRIAFAVCLDFIFPSTVKLLLFIGLCQISWSPLPWRTRKHPFST